MKRTSPRISSSTATFVSFLTQRDATAAGVSATTKTPLPSSPRPIASTHFSPGRMLSGAIQARQPASARSAASRWAKSAS